MKNKLLKLLSLLMAFILVFTIIPIGAYAADNEKTSEVQVVELEDYRDTYSKTFETSEGTNVVIASAAPLHYEEDGKMKEIDNTLVSSKKDNSLLTNKSNAFSVELPKKYNKDSEISLDYKGDSISFKIISEDISKSKGTIIKTEKAEVDKSAAESVAYEKSNIEKITSSITYENIIADTDFEYSITPDSLKENIIIESAPEEEFSIKYELNVGNLTAKLNKDNSVSLFDDEEELFVIESPYMSDSNDNSSDSIVVSLTESETGYVLEYTPELKWLLGKDISFPVTIDPTINIKGTNSNSPIEDTFVTSSSPNRSKYNLNTLTIGNNKWAYYNIKTTPTLPQNAHIKEATLNISTIANIENDETLVMHPISNSLTIPSNFISTLTWNNQPNSTYIGEDVLDYELIEEASGSYYFDITGIVKEWYSNSSNNHLLFIKPLENDTATDINVATCEYTTDQTKCPYVTIEYSVLTGIKEGYQYHTQNANMAGNAYINDYTGELVVERTDMTSNGTMGDVTFFMGKSVNAPQNKCFGDNISINYYKTLQVYNDTSDYDYIVTNADGSKEYIHNAISNPTIPSNSNPIAPNNNPNQMIYEYSVNDDLVDEIYSSTVLSSNDNLPNNERIYVLVKRIIKKEHRNNEANNSTFEVSISYNSNKICSISDELVKYDISYDNTGVISEISRDENYCGVDSNYLSEYSEDNAIMALNNTYAYTVENNTKKLNITLGSNDAVNAYSFLDVSYEFNDSNEITKIIDENGCYYEYSYNSNNQITKVQEYSSNDDEGDYLTFSYGYNSTAISNGTDTYIESFDSDGYLVSTVNNNGDAVFVKYKDGLISKVSNKRNSQQYIINRYEFDNSNDTLFSSDNNDGSVALELNDKFNGNSSVKLTTQGRKRGEFTYRIDGLYDYSTYTVAFWIKGKNNRVTLELDNSQISTSFVNNEALNSVNGWEQYYCTISTENNDYIDVNVIVQNLNYSAAKTVLIDHMYIQKSSELVAENLISNNDFVDGLDGWINDNDENDVEILDGYITQTEQISTADQNRLVMPGILNGSNGVSQIVEVSDFNVGDKYSYGAWMKAEDALPEKTGRDFSISIYAISEGNNDDVHLGTTKYSTYEHGWHYISGEISIPAIVADSSNNYEYLQLKINYDEQIGNAYIDGVSLCKGALYVSEPEEIENNSNSSSSMSYEYDNFGNVAESAESVTENDFARIIFNQFEYSNNGSLITKSIGPFGNYVDAKFDYFGNVSYKNDENGCITEYDYNNFHVLSNIIKSFDSSNITDDYDKYNDLIGGGVTPDNSTTPTTLKLVYTYKGNRLDRIETINAISEQQKVTVNTFEFVYDNWNNLSMVYINDTNHHDTPFIRFVYDNNYYRQLTSVIYVNGQQINYIYDDNGNIIHEYDGTNTQGSTLSYNYYYYDDGTCYGKKDLINNTIESYQDGLTTVMDEDGNVIHSYEYDVDGNKYEHINDRYFTTINSAGIKTVNAYGITSSIHRTYDEFGRIETEKMYVGNDDTFISKEYSYYAHGINYTETPSSTNLNDGYVETSRIPRFISYYYNNGNSKTLLYKYSYMYYYNSDIGFSLEQKMVGQNLSTVIQRGYEYNSANMIIEDMPYYEGTGYNYEYDNQGNLSYIKSTTKREYPLPNIVTSRRLIYDQNQNATNMNNCLTQVNSYSVNTNTNVETLTDSLTIGYDALGNMQTLNHTDGAIIFNWVRGNVLDSASTYDNSTNTTYDVMDYKYDDNNIRTEKNVNYDSDTQLSVKYIWDNEKLVVESLETNSSMFVSNPGAYETYILYDQDNNAYGFILHKTADENGDPVDSTEVYYYIKDSQNTIRGIMNASGNRVVTYEYSSYGVPRSTATTGYNYLVGVNPLIYRDNIYDSESGMYYLKSRYYVAEFGRFLSADLTFNNGSKTIMSANPYAYCENDPINNSAIDNQEYYCNKAQNYVNQIPWIQK